jgi:hypothetical protein
MPPKGFRRSCALSLRWYYRLLLCRVEFCGEQKPIFSDQKPGVGIFRLPSLSSSFQAILSKLTVSGRRHNTHLKNQYAKINWCFASVLEYERREIQKVDRQSRH